MCWVMSWVGLYVGLQEGGGRVPDPLGGAGEEGWEGGSSACINVAVHRKLCRGNAGGTTRPQLLV